MILFRIILFPEIRNARLYFCLLFNKNKSRSGLNYSVVVMVIISYPDVNDFVTLK